MPLFLDVLHPPRKVGDQNFEQYLSIVTPFLRPFDSPIFDTFGEVTGRIRQIFEVKLNLICQKTPHRLSTLRIAVYA